MMKKCFLTTVVASVFMGAAAFGAGAPNILLILTDDQGWSQVSEAMDPRLPESRSEYLETPNMARLMKEGMRFTSGYSPAPLCTPTRRSIQCGTSAARSGTEFPSPKWIPAEHLTIPKALKAANADYRCAHFGKWGEQMISTPGECGYDVSDGMTGNVTGGMPSSLGIESGDHAKGPPHFIDNEDPKRTRTMTGRAIGFMKEQVEAKKPFYVQASYYAVHLSVVTSENMLVKYIEKGTPDRGYPQAWAAMLEELDGGVGQLLDAIDEMGIGENTYVFFTADNGGRGTVPGGDEEGRLPTNEPLFGAKHSLLEGGIRVPFVARGPGIAAGSVCYEPVAGYDFLPTFQDLAGGKKEALSDEVDGVSLAPLFANPRAALERPEGALFFHRPGRMMSAIREGPWKLFLTWNQKGEVESRALHHVGKNPREGVNRNAVETEAVRAAAMEKRLMDFLASVDAEKVKPVKKKGKGAARR